MTLSTDGPFANEEREWLRITLSSIGDGVIAIDSKGNVALLNPVAQALTGWTLEEALGVPLEKVFVLINEESRLPVESPTVRALKEGVVVGLLTNTVLVAKNRTERAIDHSAAPIRDAEGNVSGVVMVFRDVSQQRRQEKEVLDALSYADNIIATMREPFVVLDKDLRVRTANTAFYHTFHLSKELTENRLLFELDNSRWENPQLRSLLGDVLSANHAVEDFEVEFSLPNAGRLIMLLNARRIVSRNQDADLILLAIEDVTQRRKKSEEQYRRLFESARDGILILDEKTGKIIDANPFMSELLGYNLPYFLGKELWEIGLFKDIAANQAAFQELQKNGYIRYDHLPLETRDKRKVDVEFVSNAYEADGRAVIQCNIRDCSERARLEKIVKASLDEKEVLLKEVHHRVKNNLQVISSLLHLQSQHTTDPASVQMFLESQNRVRSMALVHERLYRSKDLARVDFGAYIESLARNLFTTHQVDIDRINLVVNVHGVQLAIDAAIPCGLLLNELISNCLKHAFVGREKGRIQVEMQTIAEGEIQLQVSDDGIGAPPDIEPRTAKTFGMQLIADLVEQLHGRIHVFRDGGTTVQTIFPAGQASHKSREDRP